MLTKSQEKLVINLQTKKGRIKHGLCIVEGAKVIEAAGEAVEWTFTAEETLRFSEMVTTDTPQAIAGVARIPEFHDADIASRKTLVLLAGVQDPGNVGTILRLCFGFDASLLLVDSVDVTNSKVIRSSVGALFHVPWRSVRPAEVATYIEALQRPVFRLEHTAGSQELSSVAFPQNSVLVAGSEGRGIQLPLTGDSIHIQHSQQLESLNVASALSIALYTRYSGTTAA